VSQEKRYNQGEEMKERIAFLQTSAHRKLRTLRDHPFDLHNGDDEVMIGRANKYLCRSQHFTLHYWTQRITDEVLDGLQELADQCRLVEQFKEMKAGGMMNGIAGIESEERQVLHTACRDIFTAQPCHAGATGQAAFELERLDQFLAKLDSGEICNEKGERFNSMIHVGIGGSDLGPRSVFEALRPFGQPGRRVYFISNVDPDDGAAVLQDVDLSRALVSIVSKSGTTLETLTNEMLVRQAFTSAGLDPLQHFVAVTGQGSPMDDADRYLRSFHMFDYIGGRYSTTSMVGMVMLGFYLGYKQALDFLRGAAKVDYEAENPAVRENQALLLAMLGIWNHSYLDMPTLAVLPYSQALHRFPAHLQQCDMESNGKSVNRVGEMLEYMSGPVVWGEPGTNGQHAFYQLLHQGTEVVPCEFIGFRRSQHESDMVVDETSSQQKLVANLLAQSTALARGRKNDNRNRFFPGNRPNSVLLGERLTPEVMGALLALYEAKIIYQGFTWNINSFDQEGVQLGKVLATRLLDEMKAEKATKQSLEWHILKTAEMV
jgi:glucose-6-phosphate isomerase